jgi:hypothetical protein
MESDVIILLHIQEEETKLSPYLCSGPFIKGIIS